MHPNSFTHDNKILTSFNVFISPSLLGFSSWILIPLKKIGLPFNNIFLSETSMVLNPIWSIISSSLNFIIILYNLGLSGVHKIKSLTSIFFVISLLLLIRNDFLMFNSGIDNFIIWADVFVLFLLSSILISIWFLFCLLSKKW